MCSFADKLVYSGYSKESKVGKKRAEDGVDYGFEAVQPNSDSSAGLD